METLLRAGLSNAVAATVMAAIVTLLSRPLARRPAVVHGLWLLVLIKLVTPPFYEVPIAWPRPAFAAAEVPLQLAVFDDESADDVPGTDERAVLFVKPAAGEAAAGTEGSVTVVDWADAIPAIAAVWLAGSLAVLIVSGRRVLRFHRLLKEAKGGSESEQEDVDGWAAHLGLERPPGLWWVPGAVSPMIWFVVGRPRLIVPRDLWKRLDARQRATLITHELAHLRRGDHFVRLLETAVMVLFWWHPLVWWMRGPLRDAEEQCCDAWVVWALPEAARAYADTLLDTLEFLEVSRRPDPLLASGLGQVSTLKRRLTMILSGSTRRRTGLPGRLGLLSTAAVLLPMGASWAQKADEPVAAIHKDGKVVFFDAVKVTNDGAVETGKPGEKVVVVAVNQEGDSGHRVELSGPMEEVKRKLKAKIGELKKIAAKDPAAKAQAEGLEQALEAIEQAEPAREQLGVRARARVDADETHDFAVFRMRGEPDPKKAGEIAKAREEVDRLRKDVDAAVERLRKAQARLRSLGADPGEIPNVRWSRINGDRRVEYQVVRDIPPRIRAVRPFANVAPPRSDQQRLEQLEKRLKELQDEVGQLKKGSADESPKKK